MDFFVIDFTYGLIVYIYFGIKLLYPNNKPIKDDTELIILLFGYITSYICYYPCLNILLLFFNDNINFYIKAIFYYIYVPIYYILFNAHIYQIIAKFKLNYWLFTICLKLDDMGLKILFRYYLKNMFVQSNNFNNNYLISCNKIISNNFDVILANFNYLPTDGKYNIIITCCAHNYKTMYDQFMDKIVCENISDQTRYVGYILQSVIVNKYFNNDTIYNTIENIIVFGKDVEELMRYTNYYSILCNQYLINDNCNTIDMKMLNLHKKFMKNNQNYWTYWNRNWMTNFAYLIKYNKYTKLKFYFDIMFDEKFIYDNTFEKIYDTLITCPINDDWNICMFNNNNITDICVGLLNIHGIETKYAMTENKLKDKYKKRIIDHFKYHDNYYIQINKKFNCCPIINYTNKQLIVEILLIIKHTKYTKSRNIVKHILANHYFIL